MKKSLSIGVILLFLLSAYAPIGLGLNVKTDIVIEPEITAVSDGPMDSAWPMYMHDTRHTGRSPYSTADNPGIEKWRFNLENDALGDPVIDNDGIIYIGSHDFYAIYPNGTLKWKYDTPIIIHSAPAIDENGVVYIGTYLSDPGYLFAFYPDGSEKWKYSTTGSIYASPVIAEDGTIIFADCDNWNIVALSPEGNKIWSYHTNNVIHSDPAIDNNTVYCGSHDGYLYALYLNNGTLKWKYKTGDWVARGPSIAEDGIVYFGSWDGHLYACYPNNGTLKWKTSVGACSTPTIAHDGTIYIGLDYLSAINLSDGSIKWQFNPGSERTIRGAGPSISSDGTIFIGTHIDESEGGELIAVNPDGTERWRILLATSWIWSSPAIGEDGTVYIGSCNNKPPSASLGYLHAINNLDPNAPTSPEINGPSSAKEDTEHEINFTSTSPLNRDVFYYIEWGDGKTTDWDGPYQSGEEMTLGHAWGSPGSYTIRARAKDTDNLWGPWGEFEIEITRPRTRTSSHWMRFLDMFPILKEVILRLIR